MSQATPAPPDLAAVHDRLRAILAPYRDRLRVASDGPGGMTLELPDYPGQPWGFAAGTRLGKRYVSYYLMGVYGDAGLAASISPELRRRMQGKSCFNFTKIDDALFSRARGADRPEHRTAAGNHRGRAGIPVEDLTTTQSGIAHRNASAQPTPVREMRQTNPHA